MSKKNERTIRIRGFSYYTESPDPRDPSKIKRKVRLAARGTTVELSEEDIARGEELNAFANSPGDVITPNEQQAMDAEGNPADPAAGGSSVDPSEYDVVEVSDDDLDVYLTEAELNVPDTVALARGDKESAQRLIDAENRLSSNDPRKGVITGLEKILKA